jgi:glutamyl/glutaminyl-tRNA synthetase
MVRVRFAPSPTGLFAYRRAPARRLFNWMYAKAQGGQFVLRIEDTDQVRSKNEYFEEILDSMKWLGLTWDEFYKQSDRFDIYRQYAQKLLTEGKAYKDMGRLSS